MAQLALASLPPFDISERTNISPRWTKWMQRFENRVIALDITDPGRKLALLLDYAGEDVHDDYLTLTIPAEQEAAAGQAAPANQDVYSRSLIALNNHYAPQVQIEYEIFNFREAAKSRDETLDQYVTRLRKLGATCAFTSLDAEIKSQIIQKGRSTKLRTKALADLTISLEALIKQGKAMERAMEYTQGIEKKEDNKVNQITSTRGRGNYRRPFNHFPRRGSHSNRGGYGYDNQKKAYEDKDTHSTPTNKPTRECGHCGGPYPHDGGREKCPAYNSTCRSCGITGHWEKNCRSGKPQAHSPANRSRGRGRGYRTRGNRGRRIHSIEVSDAGDNQFTSYHAEEEAFIFTLRSPNHNDQPMFLVKINGTPIKMLGDSGAPVNIIDEPALYNLHPKPTLTKPDMKLYPYGPKEEGRSLPLLGMFHATLTAGDKSTTAPIYVTEGSGGVLLGKTCAEKLDLIKINHEAIISKITKSSSALIEEYADRFEGMGKLVDYKVKIHIDPNVIPITQPHRRIPFHLREKVEA